MVGLIGKIEVIPRKYTFKIEGIKNLITVEAVNDGMAWYRLRNEYPVGNAKIINEEII